MNFGVKPLTSFDQVCQQLAPLCPELVCTRQAAVASNHTQVGDAQLDQVAGSLCASLLGTEILAAGAANHSPTLESGSRRKWLQYHTGITGRQIRRRDELI